MVLLCYAIFQAGRPSFVLNLLQGEERRERIAVNQLNYDTRSEGGDGAGTDFTALILTLFRLVQTSDSLRYWVTTSCSFLGFHPHNRILFLNLFSEVVIKVVNFEQSPCRGSALNTALVFY